MSDILTEALENAYSPDLAKELVTAYQESKRAFHLGVHRLCIVEGGRFCEAAYRILQFEIDGAFTPIGEPIDSDGIERRLRALPKDSTSKAIRIYIPRALRVAYDIRNSRNAAHLAPVNRGLQDATLVVALVDWILAEFLRLTGRIADDRAERLIEGLVTRAVPVIQKFGTYPKVLRPDLRAGEYVLVILYHLVDDPIKVSDLASWVRPSMVKNLKRTLRRLEADALVHLTADTAQITYAGQRYVESRKLLLPLNEMT
jgi:hypothetical protein